MLHRLLVFAGVLLAALALAVPALAVRVHVRVDAPNATIFGPAEPLVTPVTGTFTPPDGPAQTLSQPTALGALEAASRKGEFYYRIKEFAFGPFIDRIGRRESAGTSGWVYKVNGVVPPVGADKYVVKAGDRVLWYFATFGPEGGPPTLALRRRLECFQALAVDDKGTRTAAREVVFLLDDRRIRSRSGSICPRGHWHTLRATKAGTIRSRVVRAPRGRGPLPPRLAGIR